MPDAVAIVRRTVPMPDGATLAMRLRPGGRRPYLLVHGLASNARLWDRVSERLALAGHEVVAVDLRGHGESTKSSEGHSTHQAASDLEVLITCMGWSAERLPTAVGQSWGGNVVLNLASRSDLVDGVCGIDGGWIHLADRYPTFDECWRSLAPPDLTRDTWEQVRSRLSSMVAGWPNGALEAMLANLEVGKDGLVRNRLPRQAHRDILFSLWTDNPCDWYSSISAATQLIVAGGPDDPKATAVREAARRTSADVRWHPGTHHDVHVQHPDLVADDLLTRDVSVNPHRGER